MLGSHRILHENYSLLGCDTVSSGGMSTLKRGRYVSPNVGGKFLSACTMGPAEDLIFNVYLRFIELRCQLPKARSSRIEWYNYY